MYDKNKEYDIRYVDLDGKEQLKQITPTEDMSKPQMIMKLKEEDKNFFKLLESEKEENKVEEKECILEDVDRKPTVWQWGANELDNIINAAKKELEGDDLYEFLQGMVDTIKGAAEDSELEVESKKIEESSTNKKLFDYLKETDFEDVDVTDNEIDMMVAFCLDIEDADSDPFSTYLSILAKDLNVINAGEGIVTVDLTRHVTDNFDLYEELFDCNGDSKEEEIADMVEKMSGVISGYTSDEVYSKLVSSL